jgi:dienelactone hydrolase
MGTRFRALILAAPLALAACGHTDRLVTRDLTYRSGGRTVEAYLVHQAGTAAARPGVVVVHGSGGDREELLGRAKELARRGAVVVVPTMPSSTMQGARPTSVRQLLEQSRVAQDADVAAVERAGDLLRAQPGVRRLGYLGWSAGAKTGALVAAADPRFAALALLSAGAEPVAAFAAAAPSGTQAEVRRMLTPIDPIHALARARPGTVLLEDGTRDEVVPRRALENVIRAAPPRTTVRWYETPHALSDRAYADAIDWLYARLQ